MKKNDLRTAIGGIRARDELIADTMDKIARYRTEQCESRGASHRRFGLGLRIASAACAFALVVGVGLFIGLRGNNPNVISDMNDPKTVDNNDANTPDTYSNKKELSELREIAQGIDGDWMIVWATVESCMMSDGVATVGLTVGDFLAYSEGFDFDNENISAEFTTDSQNELDGIIESLTSQRYFLLSLDTESGEDCWIIEKYL